MRSDWGTVRLGESFDLIPGFAFKSADFRSIGVPVLKIKNVRSNRVLLEDTDFVDPSFVTTRPEQVARRGDVLLSMTGNRMDGTRETWVGKAAFFLDDSGSQYMVNQRVGILRPKQRTGVPIDPRFCLYCLCSDEYQDRLIAVATSSGGQANLSSAQVHSIEMPLPPLGEQRRIASILGALDDKIAANERIARTLYSMADALFRSWFIDFDGCSNIVDSPSGPIPKGWRIGTLEEICDRIVDRVDDVGSYGQEPLIDLARIPRRSLAVGDWGTGSELSTSISRFERFDTLFGAIRAYFHKVVLAPFAGVTNTSVFVIRARRSEDISFLCLQLFQDSTVAHATRVAGGTTMPVTKWADLASMPIVVPPSSVRTRFQQLTGPHLERIAAGSQQNRTLAQLRDTLLPKLISGEIRVPEAEDVVEAAL